MMLFHSNLFFFSLTAAPLAAATFLAPAAVLPAAVELLQYRKNWMMIMVFRMTPTMYCSLKEKSSDSIRTVPSLAMEPAKFRKKLKKARAPVDLFE